ncbi:MAG: hypothetical protein ABWK00_02040 [Desulfurococcaceae archaeon]
MDFRLVVAGANILAVAAGFLAYGALNGMPSVVGASLSAALAGAVALVVGLSAGEPLDEFLAAYAGVLERNLVRVLEDADVAGARPIAVDGKVIFSRGGPASDAEVGLGFRGGPYVALDASGLADVARVAGSSLEGALNELLCRSYGVCSDALAREEGELARVVLRGVPARLLESVGRPINPLAIATLAVASGLASGRPVELLELRRRDDIVEMVLRVS